MQKLLGLIRGSIYSGFGNPAMTKSFRLLFAFMLLTFGCSLLGHAQFKQQTAGDSIQDAIKASAADHNAQPAAEQQSDDTSPKISGDLGGLETAPYVARVRQTLGTNWHHLINSSGIDVESKNGTTVVEFTITREGEIRDVQMIRSSDQDDLDDFALQCISLSNPLPAPPKGIEKKALTLRMTFKFRGAKKPGWKRR